MDIVIIGRIFHPEVWNNALQLTSGMGKDTGPGHAHGEAERCAWGNISPFPHGLGLPDHAVARGRQFRAREMQQ